MTKEEFEDLKLEYPSNIYEGYSINFDELDNVLNPLLKDKPNTGDTMVMVWIIPTDNIKAMVYKASYDKELLINYIEEYFKDKQQK